jgi:hypothetical protein
MRDNAETRPGISSGGCCGYKAQYKCECEATGTETECETECETETKTEASLQASLQRRVARGAFSLEERARRELESGSETRRGPVGVRVKGGRGALWVVRVSGAGRGAGFGSGLVGVVQRRPVWSTAGTTRWPTVAGRRSAKKSAGEWRSSVRSASSSTGARVIVGADSTLRAGPGRRTSVRQACSWSVPRTRS